MTPAAVFDRMAARYDELWSATATGRAQRKLVWRWVDEWFRPGERILDIGCGTGEDAAHLAARGLTVLATDVSAAMVAAAQSRGGFRAEVLAAEDIAQLDGTFDGALSNFGALNCVADLAGVAGSLARLVRPGGRVAICLLGRVCAWETLYYLARLQVRKAFRRWGRGGADFHGMTVRYPSTAAFRAAFAEGFELHRWTGIGLCVPPSYVKLPPPAVRWLSGLDGVLARLPLLRGLADHRLFLLVRKA